MDGKKKKNPLPFLSREGIGKGKSASLQVPCWQ